ncbi:MAG: Uncharacterised protein [Glaciecola sp. HTCC2999]|jgi:uncharacterized membrane protein YfcA|nr:MAG: Uncharacterised protein [Glaciecola sp. HTCC2999]
MLTPDISILLICIALGSVVGLSAGLLGIGGGLIVVPALTYLLSYFLAITPFDAITIAIATSLSTIILTGLSSSRAHYQLGNLEFKTIVFTGLGIAVGASAGGLFASSIDGLVLKGIFATLVIAVALYMMFGKKKPSRFSANRLLLLFIGLITGFISAMMGIGGGAILVPAMVFFQIDMRKAIGCAAVSGLIIALFGTTSFIIAGWSVPDLPAYSLGYVYLPATLGIVLSSVFTAPIGAKIGQSMDTQKLKQIFAIFLVLVSIRMLIGIL